MTEHEPTGNRFLDFIDTWKLAAGVAFVAIALLTIWDLKLWVDLNNVVEDRAIELQASNQEQVNNCFNAVAQGPALRRALRAIERELEDPLGQIYVRDLLEINARNTPTLAECTTLAVALGIAIPRNVGG